MADTTPANTRKLRSRHLGGYRLVRVGGIDLVADWSLIIIFALILVGLGTSLLPAWHPTWSPLVIWTTAGLAALALLASVAIHEFSHAWVANRNGMVVRRITLFIFGGMAHLEGRPASPAVEFKVAGIGPLVSLALGLLFLVLGSVLAQPSFTADDPAEVVAQLSPLATLLLWLGPINILLAAFNLLPGFPLDGGRVLRAALWRLTGDLRRATRWSSRAGQALAWTLMILGVAMLFGLWIPVFGGGPLNGIWLLLIGWFLNNAARMSYHQLVVKDALEDVAVRDLMRVRPDDHVSPITTISDLIERYAMTADTTVLPIVGEDHRLIGMVDLATASDVPAAERTRRGVTEVMTPAADLNTVRPDTPAFDALEGLTQGDPLPVVAADQTLVGLLTTRDLSRWLAFRADADLAPPARSRWSIG